MEGVKPGVSPLLFNMFGLLFPQVDLSEFFFLHHAVDPEALVPAETNLTVQGGKPSSKEAGNTNSPSWQALH